MELGISHPLVILLVGILVVLAMLAKSGCHRAGIPPLIGYILLGFLLSCIDVQVGCVAGCHEIFKLLAEIGVIVLLFRIGLESNVSGLLHQLRRASLIWVAGVLCSGLLGYLAAALILGLPLISSLFVAIALTATSIGVSVAAWQDAQALNSSTGELLIDVAELDDISGIVLMALLFAVVPVLQGQANKSLLPVVGLTAILLLAKLAGFGTFCSLFSLWIERQVTEFFARITSPPHLALVVAGISFMMAALAALLGFSVAIGAFFAGLVFSRDPQAVKIDASFEALYDFFSPFFFIGIGLNIDPGAISAGLELGLLLLVVAILGKLLGHGLPAVITLGWTGALVLGLSMIPRAEIAMIIMERGLSLGSWAVPPAVYAAMVLVLATTCIISPITVRPLLRRWPQIQGG
ncbi:MAG: cation:proton antiporter [Desulfobacteraceae bacterium]